MVRIASLTMNPAIDASTRVRHVAANRKLRCEPARHEPGGGGINVSVAMKELGCDSTAVFPCGGPPGDMLCELVASRHVEPLTVSINGWTRRNLSAFDMSSDDQYRFVMPGPALTPGETQACLDAIDALDPRPDYLVFSGSLPTGVGPEFVEALARECRRKEVRLVVDTSGASLDRAVQVGVFLLKPNMRELQDLLATSTSSGGPAGSLSAETEEGQEEALQYLVAVGAAEVIVLSLGAAGVVLADSDGITRMRAPAVPIASRVGAGDSMIAGIMVGLSRGYDIRRAVLHGVAAGSAAVMTPGTELCRRKDVQTLFEGLCGEGML